MKAKDIDFKKGMNIRIKIKSPYGKEFDESKECEVISLKNYKKGQLIKVAQYSEFTNPTGFGIWKNECIHNIEII